MKLNSSQLRVVDSSGQFVGSLDAWHFDYANAIRLVNGQAIALNLNKWGFIKDFVALYYVTSNCSGTPYLQPALPANDAMNLSPLIVERVLVAGTTGYFNLGQRIIKEVVAVRLYSSDGSLLEECSIYDVPFKMISTEVFTIDLSDFEPPFSILFSCSNIY